MALRAGEKLAELALLSGEPVASSGNQPVRLDDPGSCWYVEDGTLDVFLVETRGGEPASSFKHMLRAGGGRLVFGVDAGETPLMAVAKGLDGSRLRRIRVADVAAGAADELAEQVEAWVVELAGPVARSIDPRPPADRLIGFGEQFEAPAGSVLSARLNEVVWIAAGVDDGTVAAPGTIAYLGTEEPNRDGTGLVPVTADTWLTLLGDADIGGLSSRELGLQGRLLAALGEFHRMALSAEFLNRRLLLADEANLQTARVAHRRRDAANALSSLFGVLGSSRAAADGSNSPLLAALKAVGDHEGITFRSPPRRPGAGGEDPALESVVSASGVRAREVRLVPEDRWWRGDSGAMLAFRRDSGAPVAVLPGAMGGYRSVEPATGRRRRLNADRAAAYGEKAWFFYTSLPAAPVRSMDLIRFAMARSGGALVRLALAGIGVGVLLMMPALLVGLVVDRLIPLGESPVLAQATAGLVILALLGALLKVLQGTAMLQLEGRAVSRLSAAVWDRVLNLPLSFFRSYTAGDLGVRMSAFLTLRDQSSGVVAAAALSVVLMLPALVLMFAYNAVLAWLSLGIGLAGLAVIVATGLRQIGPQRRRHAAVRRLSGDLFQFINGMGKLRAAGAELSAVASWARNFREQQLATVRVNRVNQHLVGFSLALPAVAVAALFLAASWQGTDDVSPGEFLAVLTASLVFFGAIVGLGQSFRVIASCVPTYEEIRPVLEAVPETAAAAVVAPRLSGEVAFDHVSFRYHPDGPLILDDVSIRVRAGEFVAIAGESGAGKSTLVRLALGLERPSSGAIYYDGVDLAKLDKHSVRRQVGVVVQDGALQPGTIFDNIVGAGAGQRGAPQR